LNLGLTHAALGSLDIRSASIHQRPSYTAFGHNWHILPEGRKAALQRKLAHRPYMRKIPPDRLTLFVAQARAPGEQADAALQSQ
jgi:hypothetical protein